METDDPFFKKLLGMFVWYLGLEKNVTKLNHKALYGEKRMIIDFKDIINESQYSDVVDISLLVDYILTEPLEAEQMASIAAQKVCFDIPSNFKVHFKNWPPEIDVDINAVRLCDEGKVVSVQGMIKSKSEIYKRVTAIRYKCECGGAVTVAQNREDELISGIPACPRCKKDVGMRVDELRQSNEYFLTLEEAADEMSGENPQGKILVVCRDDFSETDIERKVVQGYRAKITGVLKTRPKLRNGRPTTNREQYLQPVYIHMFEETFLDITWSPAEEEKFKQIGQAQDTMGQLKESIFMNVYGHNDKKDGLILQLFGGVENIAARKSSEIHVLLVGDPGTGKTEFLNSIRKVHPKVGLAVGGNLTKVGIIGAAIKDERTGRYQYDAGPLVLSNRGILEIDEFDKMPKEHQTALNQALSNQQITVVKAGINITLTTKTSVLVAMNPKHGRWSVHDLLYHQIELDATFLSRMDLLYFFHAADKTEEEASKESETAMTRGDKPPPLSPMFLRKYIAYAKKIDPKIPPSVQKYLHDEYLKTYKIYIEKHKQGVQLPAHSLRIFNIYVRLTEAHARMKLRTEATMEDAVKAVQLGFDGLRKMGYDDAILGVNKYSVTNEYIGGVPTKLVDMKARTERVLREMAVKEPMEEEAIISLLVSEGYELQAVEKYIEYLHRSGSVMRPRYGLIKWNM